MGNLLALKSLKWLAMLYTALLAVGSLIHPPRLVENPPDNFDKLLHFTAYFGLMILWGWVALGMFTNHSKNRLLKKTLLISLACVVYGIVIEAFQYIFTQDRTADYLDMLANTIGVAVGLIIVALFIKKSTMLKRHL